MTLDSIGKEGEVKPFYHPHHPDEFASHRDGNENAGGYQVRALDAIYQLREHNPDAYEWWTKYVTTPAQAMSSVLVFREDVCEVVES